MARTIYKAESFGCPSFDVGVYKSLGHFDGHEYASIDDDSSELFLAGHPAVEATDIWELHTVKRRCPKLSGKEGDERETLATELGFPSYTDEELEAARTAYESTED